MFVVAFLYHWPDVSSCVQFPLACRLQLHFLAIGLVFVVAFLYYWPDVCIASSTIGLVFVVAFLYQWPDVSSCISLPFALCLQLYFFTIGLYYSLIFSLPLAWCLQLHFSTIGLMFAVVFPYHWPGFCSCVSLSLV